ncbi:shikimate kinase [Aeromicrobium fastidiosum]|uniref:Shikimate kinase n=1 Tax=Aeromicrobium fastidiosum TaxID=52699 RepID=A0A641AK25_9ACTN|nr:shikimate kinase [Aeromicrobium fastidiosum]KAA1376165.1 shikimate kinase [Aeromicrobium fastidiosum]MBP2391949.1 shikimate kinase [Aeromicrobium fastidiosum]
MSPVVVLVGPPGAGKTTVALELAERWGVDFRDTDQDIEKAKGVTIQELFVDHGEPHFRELEEKAVAAALSEHDGVLAVGGGAVMSERTRALLADHRVLFLDVGLAAGVQRAGVNGNRPLLLGNIRGRMKILMDQRRPLYEEVATYTILTDALDASAVADRAAQLIKDPA